MFAMNEIEHQDEPVGRSSLVTATESTTGNKMMQQLAGQIRADVRSAVLTHCFQQLSSNADISPEACIQEVFTLLQDQLNAPLELKDAKILFQMLLMKL